MARKNSLSVWKALLERSETVPQTNDVMRNASFLERVSTTQILAAIQALLFSLAQKRFGSKIRQAWWSSVLSNSPTDN